MARITQNLFESIQKVTSGEVVEASVDKAHYCATHVEHALLGYGECISEQHAAPDEDGNIAWYTVRFPAGTHKVNTDQLRVVEGKSHMHSKKPMGEESVNEEPRLKFSSKAGSTETEISNTEPDGRIKATFDGNKPTTYEPVAAPKKDQSKLPLQNEPYGGPRTATIKFNDKVEDDDEPKLKGKVKANNEETIKEAEGGIPKTDRHKKLAAHYGDPNRITRGDVITAAKKKAMKEGLGDDAFAELDKEVNNSRNKKTSSTAEPSAIAAPKSLEQSADDFAARARKNPSGQRLSDLNPIDRMEWEKKMKIPEAKDMSAFDWKSKVKKPESGFTAKKISTGTVYTKKYKEEKDDEDLKSPSRRAKISSAVLGKGEVKKQKSMKEGVSQTVINHNDFVLEVTDNPTFKDYFAAMQAIVPSMDENIQKEMVSIATEAYNEGYTDVILESMSRQAFSDTLNNYRKAGYEILDEKYIVESGNPFVEYTVEKDNTVVQYVHTGVVIKDSE